MAESSLDAYVKRGMKGRWRWPVKHADGFTAGIPDLSGHLPRFGTVWIENKALDNWPAKANTDVKVGLEELQRHFIWQRNGWLLLRVKSFYLLFGCAAVWHLIDKEGANKLELMRRATCRWTGKIDWDEFEKLLRRGSQA